MANRIIKAFKLKPTKYPTPIGFMGRRQGSDFTKTTLDTWIEWIPEESYRINTKQQEIVIQDSVKFYYGGLDSKKNISKFNSGEMSIAFIDQAEEIEEERLIMELRLGLRKTIQGKELPRKILWTANPRVCWLKDQFIDNKTAGKIFLPALPYDNPYLPSGYIENMEETLKHMPELLKAYRDGSWDILAGADQLIKEQWINEAKDIKLHIPKKHIIAVDPARFGDDELVIYGMQNSKIIDKHYAGMSDSNYILNEIEKMAFRMKERSCPPTAIGCDTTGGWASGVEDNIHSKLKLWSFPCKFYGFNSSERQSSGVPDNFYNRKAEIWMNAHQMFAGKQVEMDFSEYPELKRQLMHFRYDYRGGKTYIQEKSEIKRILGRSPDRADAYSIGLYALRYATPEKQDSLGLFNNRENRWQKHGWMAS